MKMKIDMTKALSASFGCRQLFFIFFTFLHNNGRQFLPVCKTAGFSCCPGGCLTGYRNSVKETRC